MIDRLIVLRGLFGIYSLALFTMVQVPTPPASRPGSEPPAVKPAEDSSELLQSLDVLLEQYLNLLDRQQKLQTGLAKELSSVCPFDAI